MDPVAGAVKAKPPRTRTEQRERAAGPGACCAPTGRPGPSATERMGVTGGLGRGTAPRSPGGGGATSLTSGACRPLRRSHLQRGKMRVSVISNMRPRGEQMPRPSQRAKPTSAQSRQPDPPEIPCRTERSAVGAAPPPDAMFLSFFKYNRR